MINAVGIPLLHGDAYADRCNVLLKASYLYNVPAYIYDISDIKEYKRSGKIKVLCWNGGGYLGRNIDLPRFTEIFCGTESLFKRHPEEYAFLKSVTSFTDDVGLLKYELHRKMLTSELSQYAIPTLLIHSFDELMATSCFPHAFLKPCGGRKAKGAMKLEYKAGKLLYSTPESSGELTRDFFTKYYANSGYAESVLLLEPCLNILDDEGRAVDFRCLVSLNGEGKWQNVMTYARIGSNNVASNIALGGGYCPAENALDALVPEHSKEKLEEINRIAIHTAELVKKESRNPVSWLGIDICIDRPSNQVYVIEANSKPGMNLVGPWPLSLVRAQYFRYLLNQADTE